MDDERVVADTENHQRVRLGDDAYPELLAGIPGPPEQLYIVGDPEVLHLPALAIVGSRNPTSGGAQNAFEFARHLGRTGFCIVSGLAQGIDAAAHRGALAAGAPTVAFLGHGIDRVYPAANHANSPGRLLSTARSSASSRWAPRRTGRCSRSGTG